jgi:hypothetical protein
MILNREHTEYLKENGYLTLRSVVPDAFTNAALRAINHAIGEGISPDHIDDFRKNSFCPQLVGEPVITDLIYATPLWKIVQKLLGYSKVKRSLTGQIAIRFPIMDREPPAFGCHIDGLHRPGFNSIPCGVVRSFTALVMVFLSDVLAECQGNFTVWPRSHRLMEQHVRSCGVDALLGGMPRLCFGPPLQMLGRKGDAVIANYLLAHAAAPNLSPHPRYAVFFRIRHIDHASHRPDAFRDAWFEWEGVR